MVHGSCVLIVAAGEPVDAAGPGGLKHVIGFPDGGSTPTPHDIGAAGVANLASTRVIAIPAAGRVTVFFKIKFESLSSFVTCDLYNAAFTALVLP